MGKILRNRTLSLMIAIFAIITNVLSPEVLSEVQGQGRTASGLEICHSMMSMQMESEMDSMSSSDANVEPRSAGMKGHACCKVCVCHPAATALPTAFFMPVLLPLSQEALPAPRKAGLPPSKFSTKSSPRGPPFIV